MALYARIMVPLDGSEPALAALQAAIRLALAGQGRIRLVHDLNELAYLSDHEDMHDLAERIRIEAQQVLDSGLRACADAGVPADATVIEQPGVRFAEAVASEAYGWGADLVVVGSHGRRGLGHLLLGSGAEQLVRLSPCPVLVFRQRRP